MEKYIIHIFGGTSKVQVRRAQLDLSGPSYSKRYNECGVLFITNFSYYPHWLAVDDVQCG
jgi:hypothetical protein